MIPAVAPCDEFKIIPSLALREEYNDNIFFTTDNETRSFITTISPGLELRERSEPMDLGLTARVDVLRYTDESALDTANQYYLGTQADITSPTQRLGSSACRQSTRNRPISTEGSGIRATAIWPSSAPIITGGR